MPKRPFPAACAVLLMLAPPLQAGTVYTVTSSGEGGDLRFEVSFGGGKAFEQFTAFCQREKKFVYLSWRRGTPPPDPEAVIWDSRTGETTELYRFDGCPDPLPVIGSVEDLRVCPFTGRERLTFERTVLYD